jgi:heptosyltransferase II
MSAPSTNPAPIVVRLPNWVGDVCMSMHSMKAIAATGHPIIICARSWARPLVEPLNPTLFVPMSGKFFEDLRHLRLALSGFREARVPTVGLILPDSFSSAALFALAGIKSVGYRDDGRGWLLRNPIRKQPGKHHAVLKWWKLTQAALSAWEIGDPLSQGQRPAQFVFEPSQADRLLAREQLQAHHLSDKSFVLLAPTATGLHKGQVKVWPHFQALSETLLSRGHRVVTCPPAHERDQANALVPNALMLDPLPLGAFAALAKLSALVVCNDSGVSHLAALSGATQVSLFGVTDPDVTGPWSVTARVVGGVSCWPSLEEVNKICVEEIELLQRAVAL